MAAYPIAIQRGTLKRLDFAFRSFFRRIGGGETPSFPRFRGRRYFDSSSIVSGVKVHGNRLHIPAFGPKTIRCKGGSRHHDARPLSAVLRRTGGKWYAVVCHEVEIEEPADNRHNVGVDMNAGQIADSDGGIHRAPDMRRLEDRGRRLRRRVARRKKGSRRRDKAVRHLAKVRHKIANRRRNRHHRLCRELADKTGTIVVEGLKTAGMTRGAKGTADEPSRNVNAKSGLNRVILNTGWAALCRMLGYKAANVITVNPAYTSQTCHECGTADGLNRRSQAGFHGVACGHADHADLNAAANILASGNWRICTARGVGADHPCDPRNQCGGRLMVSQVYKSQNERQSIEGPVVGMILWALGTEL